MFKVYIRNICAGSSCCLSKYIFDQLLGDDAMWSSWVHLGALIEPCIDRIEPGREIAAYIEPPIADEDRLRELGAIGAQKRGLTSINVAIVPTCQYKALELCITEAEKEWEGER